MPTLATSWLMVACCLGAPDIPEGQAPPPPTPALPSATDVLTGTAVTSSIPTHSRVDLLIGTQFALRWQQRTPYPVWLEGGLGLFYIILPEVFVGVRTDRGLYSTERHTFSIRPGIDAHLGVNPFANSKGFLGGGPLLVPGVTADVESVWRARWWDGVHGQLGLKLGAGVFLGESEGHAKAVVLPLLGFTFGLEF